MRLASSRWVVLSGNPLRPDRSDSVAPWGYSPSRSNSDNAFATMSVAGLAPPPAADGSSVMALAADTERSSLPAGFRDTEVTTTLRKSLDRITRIYHAHSIPQKCLPYVGSENPITADGNRPCPRTCPMPNDVSPVNQAPASALTASQAEILDRGFLASKRWTKLIPIAFVTYSLAYLDRSNFSIAVAGGMKSDLSLSASLSALVGASFFLGYFFFQIPGAIYAERKSAVRLVFWSLIAWGALASLQGLLTSSTALIIVRFFVGVVEAAVLPAMVILL